MYRTQPEEKSSIWEVAALMVYQIIQAQCIQKKKQEYINFLEEKEKINSEVRFAKSE